MPTLIERLTDKIVRDHAIIFVGSTFQARPGDKTRLDLIADRLATEIDYDGKERDLATVAFAYEQETSRPELIRALKQALESIETPDEDIYTRFADSLAPFSKVITTRFDQVLEDAISDVKHQRVTPIITDADVLLLDESRVALIKIRGDLDRQDTLKITTQDLERLFSDVRVLNDVVRAFFATKTLIFIGYDLNDPLFRKFFDWITQRLSLYRRQAYAIVTQDMRSWDAKYWQNNKVDVHVTEYLGEFLDSLAASVKDALPEARQVPVFAANPLEPLVSAPPPDEPYKALDSYTETDIAIFTGRYLEGQRLKNRILANRMVVVYGESGTGKTSLLRAGVLPELARERALLATAVPTPGQDLVQLLYENLLEIGAHTHLDQLDPGDLPALIKRWQSELDGPIVLVIDQFEQFFIAYGTAQERKPVAEQLRQLYDDKDIDLRLVFVIREDFLGRLHLLDESDLLPGIMDARYRLERLGPGSARAAIEKPAKLFGVTWEQELVDQLVEELSADAGIAPPQLQIICKTLYDNAATRADESGMLFGQITMQDFLDAGGTAQILGNYVDDVLESLPSTKRDTARALLGAMVSSSQTKLRLPVAELARAAETDVATAVPLLNHLSDRRLVSRYEVGENPQDLEYELTHDYLAPHIAQLLGNEFMDRQHARELLRSAVPRWQTEGQLLSPGDLRLINRLQGQLAITSEERVAVYAASAAYDLNQESWKTGLESDQEQTTLLKLADFEEDFVRKNATAQLGPYESDAVAQHLAQTAIEDDDDSVRETAVLAIIQSDRLDAVQAIVDHFDENSINAGAALVTLRDQLPETDMLIPADKKPEIRKTARRRRWQRHRRSILLATGRGALGGSIAMGLGFWLFTGLDGLQSGSGPFDIAVLIVSFVLFGGLLGAIMLGLGAFVYHAIKNVLDNGTRPAWIAASIVTGLLNGFIFMLLSYSYPVGRNLPQAFTAGFILGSALCLVVLAPPLSNRYLRLLATTAISLAFYLLVKLLDLPFAINNPLYLLLAAIVTAFGFFFAFPRPGQSRVQVTLD
jgi:hypothetical protein